MKRTSTLDLICRRINLPRDSLGTASVSAVHLAAAAGPLNLRLIVEKMLRMPPIVVNVIALEQGEPTVESIGPSSNAAPAVNPSARTASESLPGNPDGARKTIAAVMRAAASQDIRVGVA
jgi:hypothetical protein